MSFIQDNDERERGIEEAAVQVSEDEEDLVNMRIVVRRMVERHFVMFPELHASEA